MKPTILNDEALLAIGHCGEWRVETWRKIAQAQLDDTYEKTKEEVAREIFEELEGVRIAGRQIVKIPKKNWEFLKSKHLKG